MRRLLNIILITLCSAALSPALAAKDATKKPVEGPWMTGPLLAGSGHTIPKKHANFELYVFGTDSYGIYNNNRKVVRNPSMVTISPTLISSYGLTNRIDVQTSVPYDFNSRSGASDSAFGDVSLVFGFQAINQDQHKYLPDLRLIAEATFPSGRYKNLSASKNGTDATGAGSYQTTLGTNFQRLFALKNGKYLRARLDFAYTIPAATQVTGINAHGGGSGTNGTVRPGDKFSADFALEYTLTQHWVPAIDFLYTHAQKSTFNGTPGTTPSGATAMVGAPSSDGFSIAPAIEYNFNSHLGIIAGSWFSVTGRNSTDFVSGVMAINYYV